MNSSNYLLWCIARLAVAFASLMGLMYVNAARFDDTEIRTLLGFVLLGGAFRGATQ